ncbi:MAG: tetratricopeptide repeat protein [Cyclobacteriaceae bacterium]|nr:tetratricopeptide repeat protein [Cyclobacteriaceae bacterium]
MAKKGKKQHEEGVLESAEVLAEQLTKSEKFLEENRTLVFSLAGLIAIVLAGYFGYKYYMESQNTLAQDEMFQAVHYFEQDSLDLALNGDGNYYGFLDVIDNYGHTEAGNLANFYVGTIYMKKGSYTSAIPFLEDFSSNDMVIQARAYSLLGDAYMQQGAFSDAASYYTKAADYKPNKYFTPIYLMKAGLAYEKLEDYSNAAKQYEKIVEKYPESNEADKAKKYKAKLQSKS